MMQIIGLDPAFNESAHQIFQRGCVIVDATQQHRLVTMGTPASIKRAQAARASSVSSRAWLDAAQPAGCARNFSAATNRR